MKNKAFWSKILFTMFLSIVIIGCATTSGISSSNFEGVWVRSDGATFRFTGKNYELVDMENGVAAYGTFKYNKTRITFTNTLIVSLKLNNDLDFFRCEYEIRDFQKEAFEKYHKAHPEQRANNIDELAASDFDDIDVWGTGGHFQDYNITGNIFTLMERPPSPGPTWYRKSYEGEFVKQ